MGGAFFCGHVETQNLACLQLVIRCTKIETRFIASLQGGGTDGNRTSDTRIFSPLLYQLSYGTSVCGCKNTTKIRIGKIFSSKNENFLFFGLLFSDIQ